MSKEGLPEVFLRINGCEYEDSELNINVNIITSQDGRLIPHDTVIIELDGNEQELITSEDGSLKNIDITFAIKLLETRGKLRVWAHGGKENECEYDITAFIQKFVAEQAMHAIDDTPSVNPRIKDLLKQEGEYVIQAGEQLVLEKDTYEVNGDIIVEKGAELDVKPGTRLEFGSTGGIVCRGAFRAIGTKKKPIVFTKSTQNQEGGTDIDNWKNITFEQCEEGTIYMYNCLIEYGGGRDVLLDEKTAEARVTPDLPHLLEQSTNVGGGLSLLQCGENHRFDNVKVARCRATKGGGVYLLNSQPDINNSTISENTSEDEGGGICMEFYVNETIILPSMKNCVVTFNHAEKAKVGGGISLNIQCKREIHNVGRNRWNSQGEEVREFSISFLKKQIQTAENDISLNSQCNLTIRSEHNPDLEINRMQLFAEERVKVVVRKKEEERATIERGKLFVGGNLKQELCKEEDFIVAEGETLNITADIWQINCNIIISSGARLNIAPGARLEFSNNGGIVCRGTLFAIGTQENPIVFSIAGEIEKKGELPIKAWGNIVLKGAHNSKMQNCIIDYGAGRGLVMMRAGKYKECDESQDAVLIIKDSTGVILENVSLRNCYVPLGAIINIISNSDVNLIDCSIETSRGKFGINIEAGSRAKIERGRIKKNYFGNSGVKICGALSMNEVVIAENTSNIGHHVQSQTASGVEVDGVNAEAFLMNCHIHSNEASRPGGGLRVEEGKLKMKGCIIENNTYTIQSFPTDYDDYIEQPMGGGIYIKVRKKSDIPMITGCTVRNNSVVHHWYSIKKPKYKSYGRGIQIYIKEPFRERLTGLLSELMAQNTLEILPEVPKKRLFKALPSPQERNYYVSQED